MILVNLKGTSVCPGPSRAPWNTYPQTREMYYDIFSILKYLDLCKYSFFFHVKMLNINTVKKIVFNLR